MLKKSLSLLVLASLVGTQTVAASGLREPGVPNLNLTTPNNPYQSSSDAWAEAFAQYLQGLYNLGQPAPNTDGGSTAPAPTTPTQPTAPLPGPTTAINASLSTNNAPANDIAGHPWENLLLYAADRQYLNVTSNSVRPQTTITRGEFAFGLGNFVTGNSSMMSGLRASTSRRTANFTDVPSSHAYHSQINELARRSIIHTANNSAFNPNDTITREDAARFVFNLIRTLNNFDSDFTTNDASDFLSRFSDRSSVASSNRVAVAYLLNMGILTPTSNGTINPRGTLTRAEAAAMMVNLEIFLNGGPQWSNNQPEMLRMQVRHITPSSFDIEFTVNNAAIQNGANINYGFSTTQLTISPSNITNSAVLPNTTTTNIHSLRLIDTFGHHSVYAITVTAPFPESYFVYGNLSVGNLNTPIRSTTATAVAGSQSSLPWAGLNLPHWNSVFTNVFWGGSGVPSWQAPPNWGSWNNSANANNNWNNNWNNNNNWNDGWNNNWNDGWNNGWDDNWNNSWDNTSDNIRFGHRDIEDEIRSILRRPNGNISASDVRNIRELHVVLDSNSPRVSNSSLDGLEFLTGLRAFSFSYTSRTIDREDNNSSLSQFRQLEDLRNLESIELVGHNISDLRSLRTMSSSLTYLDLSHNNLRDLSELDNSTTARNMRNLNFIDVRFNNLSDSALRPLRDFVDDHSNLEWGSSNVRVSPQR